MRTRNGPLQMMRSHPVPQHAVYRNKTFRTCEVYDLRWKDCIQGLRTYSRAPWHRADKTQSPVWSWIGECSCFQQCRRRAKLRIVRNKEREKTSHEKKYQVLLLMWMEHFWISTRRRGSASIGYSPTLAYRLQRRMCKYHHLNKSYWQKLERGEITREDRC